MFIADSINSGDYVIIKIKNYKIEKLKLSLH